MPSATLLMRWTQGGETFEGTIPVVSAGNGQAAFEGNYSLTSTQANVEIAIAFDKDLLLGLFIETDKDLLVETNSSSAADDEISVVGGEGFAWTSTMSTPNPCASADVTKMFLTNGETGTATVRIRAIFDGTP